MTDLVLVRPRLRPPGAVVVLSVVVVAFGYAAYGTFQSAGSAPSTGAGFAAGALLVDVICDPLFVLALLFIWGLVAARRGAEATTAEMLIRAGRYRTLFIAKVIPSAFGLAVAMWVLAYAVVALVVVGGWATSGFERFELSPEAVLLLAAQFAGGILLCTIFSVVLGLCAVLAPSRVRFLLPAVCAISIWTLLYTSNFLGDRLPESLRVSSLLSSAVSDSGLISQVARLAQFVIVLLILCAGVSAVDWVHARRRRLHLAWHADSLLITASSTAVSALVLMGGQVLVSGLFSGYRGPLVGALVEAALTVGPAALTWVALRSRDAQGWMDAIALRAGTRSAALWWHLRRIFVWCVTVWLWIAAGAFLALLATWPAFVEDGGTPAIVVFVLAGGLAQTLIYVTLIHWVSMLISTDAVMIGFIVVLIVLPPPGIRLPFLPVHAAFDSVLVAEDPVAAIVSLAALVLGLVLTMTIALGATRALDLLHKNGMRALGGNDVD